MYEKERELVELSIQKWTSEEVFTLGWFIQVGVVIIAYLIWLKLLDRRRGTELLLIGSLSAVAKTLNAILLGNVLGLFNYTIRFAPLVSHIFATSVTISPIITMLSAQYTSTWKGYVLWTVIGNAFLNFVIFTIYTLVGALEFHNWNVFYHFLILEAVALSVRAVYLWITGTQKRALAS